MMILTNEAPPRIIILCFGLCREWNAVSDVKSAVRLLSRSPLPIAFFFLLNYANGDPNQNHASIPCQRLVSPIR